MRYAVAGSGVPGRVSNTTTLEARADAIDDSAKFSVPFILSTRRCAPTVRVRFLGVGPARARARETLKRDPGPAPRGHEDIPYRESASLGGAGPVVKSDRAMVHGSDIHLRRMYDHHITTTLAIKPHEAAPYYTSTLHISLSLSSTEPTTHELSQLARSYVKTCFVNSPPTSVGSTGWKARESQRADV